MNSNGSELPAGDGSQLPELPADLTLKVRTEREGLVTIWDLTRDGQDAGQLFLWHDSGERCWVKDRKPHREDGPAVERPDGHQEWWLDGQWHRDNAPAYIAANGTSFWYQHGKLHRGDGPAWVSAEGIEVWYRHGSQIDPTAFANRCRILCVRILRAFSRS